MDSIKGNISSVIKAYNELSSENTKLKDLNQSLNKSINSYKIELTEVKTQYSKDITDINELFKALNSVNHQ